ncbi:hypothetical protein NIASO_14550 [Niabella soli DSM 19437]|uniref:Uncharacterized protein n=1 Tax=Niabella soli DSM 19437 TaxID=929713 RepID=W0F8V8_9BACT|nr:hypothetical protein NIASO_14550 [Niabella soli DSM 19437]
MEKLNLTAIKADAWAIVRSKIHQKQVIQKSCKLQLWKT